jgi:hypothetical protein
MTNDYDEQLDYYNEPDLSTQPEVKMSDNAIHILGKMEENKMAKGPGGKVTLVSERTLNAIRKLGIEVVDDESQYQF